MFLAYQTIKIYHEFEGRIVDHRLVLRGLPSEDKR